MLLVLQNQAGQMQTRTLIVEKGLSDVIGCPLKPRKTQFLFQQHL